jgi:hypothetical protein
MVVVDLVQVCSAFHNDDPLEDVKAYDDASVEEVCDVGDDGDDGDDSNVAVGNISHRDGNIHYCLFHIHPTDTG